MLRLMDECRSRPQADMLLQKEGRHAGGYAFPFCRIAVLSNINRSQIAVNIAAPDGEQAEDKLRLRARLNVCAWLFPLRYYGATEILRKLTER